MATVQTATIASRGTDQLFSHCRRLPYACLEPEARAYTSGGGTVRRSHGPIKSRSPPRNSALQHRGGPAGSTYRWQDTVRACQLNNRSDPAEAGSDIFTVIRTAPFLFRRYRAMVSTACSFMPAPSRNVQSREAGPRGVEDCLNTAFDIGGATFQWVESPIGMAVRAKKSSSIWRPSPGEPGTASQPSLWSSGLSTRAVLKGWEDVSYSNKGS